MRLLQASLIMSLLLRTAVDHDLDAGLADDELAAGLAHHELSAAH